MSQKVFDFWFDFSCPYAYLASTQVSALAERVDAEVRWQPMLLGGVFRANDVPQNLNATLSPAKARHNADDMRRHAALWDVPLQFPPGHPNRTVTALRALLAVGAPFAPLATRFFRAYWVEERDISQRGVVAEILREAGHDAEQVLDKAHTDEIKDDLRARTARAVDLGIFGAPSFVYDDLVFWGQDRMDVVEEMMGYEPSPIFDDAPLDPAVGVDFYFDYSSPFTYIAAARMNYFFEERVRWVPVFLGGIFKSIGGPMVPLYELHPTKQRYVMADGIRQASQAGASYAWPSRFPMNTIAALRMTIAALEADQRSALPLIQRIFRAFWSEDQDINDRDVLVSLAAEVGLDGVALLERTQDPLIKTALRTNTEESVSRGAFGAPTVVVTNPAGKEGLFWGNDRLPMALRAAQGDWDLL